MDHLAPPLAADQPMYEAMTLNMLLAARTERLVIGSLVLCDAFRHPVVLAREAVTLDHASGGRFELGIGSGSVDDELVTFGVGPQSARDRTSRLGETLEVLEGLWSGDPFSYKGQFFHIESGRQVPTPLGRIPIVVGGAGPRTMELVGKHADWWNVPLHRLELLETMRPRAGAARVSIQERVVFVVSDDERAELTELAARRFGGVGTVVGSGDELVEHYRARAERGIERFYVWFSDFAPPRTLAEFGAQVISAFD